MYIFIFLLQNVKISVVIFRVKKNNNIFCVSYKGKPRKKVTFFSGRAIKMGEGGKGPAIKEKRIFAQ